MEETETKAIFVYQTANFAKSANVFGGQFAEEIKLGF